MVERNVLGSNLIRFLAATTTVMIEPLNTCLISNQHSIFTHSHVRSTTGFSPQFANGWTKSRWNRAPDFQEPEPLYRQSAAVSTQSNPVPCGLPPRFVRTACGGCFEICPPR